MALMVLLFTTGCGQAPTLAETTATAETVTNALPAMASPSDDPAPLAIDYSPHQAALFGDAVAACESERRTLCALDQYAAAYAKGGLAYTVGHPGMYWAKKKYIEYTGYRNTFQASGRATEVMLMGTDTLQQFYCCAN